ncbi:ATP-binding protein [Aliivibrio fischeri]|uniref:ATP-binding protein n=1 Tax=Aliivibrio fischeri TaxID=668 RepID=UPI0018C54250|nr:transporter substrate-binding domain-containing protein [Aliivibrio fischeri]
MASGELTVAEKKYIEEKGTVSVAMLSEPWFPYIEISDSGDYEGVYVDYLKDILSDVNIKIRFNRFNRVADILQSVKEGTSDIALGFSFSKEREKAYLFSVPLFKSSIAIWYRSSKLASLPVNKISWTCVSGSVYCEKLTENGVKNIHKADTFSKSIDLVNKGVADAMVSNYVTVSEYLNENNITEGLVKTPDWLDLEKTSIISSKKNREIISIIDKLLLIKKFNKSKLADAYHKNDWVNIAFREMKKGNETIKYSFSEDLEPVFYRNEDGTLTGYLYDFIELIERRTGLNFEYVPYDNKERWNMFRKDKIDLIPLAYSDKNKPSDFNLTDPYLFLSYISVENKVKTKNKYEKVGILVSKYNERLNLLRKEITEETIIYTNIKDLLHDISKEEIDLAYISQDLVQGILVSDINNKYILGARENLVFNMSFAIKKENEILLSVINSILLILDKDEIIKIKRSYKQFNIVYGYEKETVLQYSFIVLVISILLGLVIYFWFNNLNLQVKVKEKDKINLNDEKNWLKDLISELPNIIFIHNKDKKVVMTNCFWYKNGSCSNCLSISDLNDEDSNHILDSGSIYKDEIEIKNCHINYENLNRVRKRIHEKRNNEFFILTVISDISQQKKQEKALIEANNKTRSALIYREQFLASMSHELRTPIAGITGLIELLSKRIKGTEKQALVKNISGSMSHLHMLVNDILDYSQLEAEQLSLDIRNFYYLKELNELFSLHDAAAKEKGLNFYVNINPSNIELIKVDSLRLNQIINNIISNAIKFTNRGHVDINVSIDNNTLVFLINDTGIGIDENKLDDIFKPFTQADNTIAREFGGTGLGLNIVNKLIKLMEGQLNIKSILKIGTSVEISIPIEVVSNYSEPLKGVSIVSDIYNDNLNGWLEIWTGKSEENDKNVFITEDINCINDKDNFIFIKDVKNKVEFEYHNVEIVNKTPLLLEQIFCFIEKIKYGEISHSDNILEKLSGSVLISEDNRINQELLVSQLADIGIKSTVTNNGKEAWDELHRNHIHYDALISDCHMPIIDGFELSNKIRKELPEFDNKAIIGCTAEDSRLVRIKSENSGFNEMLLKPYGINQLHKVLSQYLNVNNKINYVYDSKFENLNNKGLMAIFIESITDDYNVLCSSENNEEMIRIMHKMKGAFSSVDMTEIVTMINDLSENSYGTKHYNSKKNALIVEIEKLISKASYWYKNNYE